MPMEQRYVLVVEDDASMSRAIERLLRAAGFLAITFPSAEAFLDSDKAPIAACLVLDISLPGISGFDLCRRLINSNVRSPVIFITARDRASSRERAKEAGAVAYLPKPFAGRDLVEAVMRSFDSQAVDAPATIGKT
jgi:FixJ family two-component response regulator